MFETQLEFWNKPVVTNTEPISAGSEIQIFSIVPSEYTTGFARIRSSSKIRKIEALSNRPAWIAAICEAGMTTGDPKQVRMDEGVTYNEKIPPHHLDLGANELLVRVELAQ